MLLFIIEGSIRVSGIEHIHDVFSVLSAVFIVLIIIATFICPLCSIAPDNTCITSCNFQNNSARLDITIQTSEIMLLRVLMIYFL